MEETRRHLDLWRGARAAGVAIEIQRNNGFYRMVVATPDRPFLFASISGALAAFGLNILKAEAFANAAHFVLDTFTFADPLRTLELNPTEFDRLRDTIARVVLGKDDVKRLLRNRPKPAQRTRLVAPSVWFSDDASPAATLIEIVAEDRPGLLYDLSSAMSQAGCNIEVVLIDTEAHKALDVFYVTAGGGKLAAERQETLRAELLAACST
jgi:[protein-PII] uridylyltransferase